MDRALSKLSASPKRSFKIQPPSEKKVTARSVPTPAKAKGAPARARFSKWFSDAPPKPWTRGPKIPVAEGEGEGNGGDDTEATTSASSSYAFFKEEMVPKLEPLSHKRILDICRQRLGSLVIRRVKRLMTSNKGRHRYILHGPDSQKELTLAEFTELDPETKATRVETFFEGTYSFVTSKKTAPPTHDVFVGQAIFGDHLGRSQFDPASLRLELASNSPIPRESNGKNPDQDDPYSLVCGVVTQDPVTKKLVFTKWAIISVQEQRAILSILEPDVSHPIRKGEVRSNPDVYRAWLLGGGRLSTNVFRRRALSEKNEGRAIDPSLYARYIGSSWGLHHCHILSFWVLLCKYGELPCKGNIPTVIPAPKPKDPEKQKGYHEDRPLTWWDLPYLTPPPKEGVTKKFTKKDRKRLDQYVVDKYELKSKVTKIRIPIHRRAACAKEYYPEIPLKEQPGKNDLAELVVTQVEAEVESDSETDSETSGVGVSSDVSVLGVSLDSGLSSDTDTPRSETPIEEIEVVAQEITVFKRPDWATVADEGEEMDFDAPLEWSKD